MKKAFTLIELLVVISIIGTLIAIISVNFTTAQKQARDSRRKEDVSSIQTALEQHYAVNNSYPSADVSSAFEGGALPTDPKDETPYEYIWNVDDYAYCVCVLLETQTGNAGDPGTATSCTFVDDGDYLCIQNQQ